MPRINYRVSRIRVIGSTAFSEASKEELRTLLALIELGGEAADVSELAEAALISTPRCKAALAFWEESGVIIPDDGNPTIVDEFEERLLEGEIDEVPAKQVASSIRDEGLKLMLDECAAFMKEACLQSGDVKILTALYTQYSLCPDFVLTLAAHMSRKGNLTARGLSNEAIRLQKKGIDNAVALDIYLAENEQTTGAEWEIRRLMGIYNRNLSTTEHELFKKWTEEFEYSIGIISEAYDIAVLNTQSGRGDLRYMDSILTSWHDAGCKTVSDCREKIEKEKLKRTSEKSAQKRQKSVPEKPRYGNFDINEAFNNAVARSFGGSDDEGKVD